MSKIIVALDGFNNQNNLIDFVREFNCIDSNHRPIFKIGKESFARFGPSLVKDLVDSGHKVFLDLKFHDIPNTMCGVSKVACDLKVDMFNIHIASGIEAMSAVVEAVKDSKSKPKIFGVTLLTSLHYDQIPLGDSKGLEMTDENLVLDLTKKAKMSGLDGIICSSKELSNEKISNLFDENFHSITPGIRITSDHDDQKRVCTPQEASELGASYQVIGRPIVQSNDPIKAYLEIYKMILTGNSKEDNVEDLMNERFGEIIEILDR